jgi:CHASE3 domain sensor protein
MQTQNLQMSKKASHQRKSTLITFDMDLEGEYETDSSIIHQKLKRQQNMVEDERH